MKRKMNWLSTMLYAMALCAVWAAGSKVAFAQHDDAPFAHRAPVCTVGTASGTYGYRMAGQFANGVPFLVNGIFTHHPDGTSDSDASVVVGNQVIYGPGSNGSWNISSNCTGTGKFRVEAMGVDVTYNFIATDGGEQIELLNTDPGILLHGYGRRISRAGKAPSCNNGTIIGSYGYRLDGSVPNVPLMIVAGTFTHAVDDNYNGVWSGTDTFNAMGQYLPRVNKGTYKLNSNCRGTGFYTDNLGNKVNYVFTVVDKGNTNFLMGADPGLAVSGVGYRIK